MLIYKKWFAARLAADPSAKNISIISHKQSLFRNLRGKVLEIGPGTGSNFRYFPKHIQWYGIEPNTFTESYLRKNAREYGYSPIELMTGRAERLPFANKTFDAVVSTHVLCSVHSMEQTLREVRRVLKTGGTFYFLEHVLSANKKTALLQRILRPMWSLIADGCHPDRNIALAMKQTGFQNVNIEHFTTSIPVIGDHICGIAIV